MGVLTEYHLWRWGAGSDLGATPGTGNTRSDRYTSGTTAQWTDTTHGRSQSGLAHLKTCCWGLKPEETD